MDENANKALIIGTSIFITIAIATGAIYSIEQIKQVYKEVYETDTSILNKFSEFDQYIDAKKSYVDVVNAIKKYARRSDVKVYVNGVEQTLDNVKDLTDDEIIQRSNEIYNSSINEEEANDTGIFKIFFTR